MQRMPLGNPSSAHWVRLNHDPLHLIERDLIAAAVVKPRGARGFVRGHLLRHFQLAAVFEVRGNSGCAERVAPDQGFYSRTTGAAPDHEVDLRLRDASFGEQLRLALRGTEQGSAFLAGDARGLDVRRHILFEVVVRRHLVALAALLMQPHPPAATLKIPVLDIHARRSANARERVDHKRDEGAIAEADGPRTECAGFTGITWPVTSQSKSIRIAASCSLTLGRESSLPSFSI